MIKKLCQIWIRFLKELIDKVNILSQFLGPACQIKEFDLQAKEVTIACYGARIIILKSSIVDVIGDPNIIGNLPSIQACWLGYYYGRLCGQSVDNKFSHAKGYSFLLRFSKGRFKLFSIDRGNIVTYIDVNTNKTYKESPLTLAQNQYIINQFDSTQACYIGILSGLIVAKQGENIIEVNRKPIFTLIK